MVPSTISVNPYSVTCFSSSSSSKNPLSLEGEDGGERGNLLILLHFRFSLGRVTVVCGWKLVRLHRPVAT